jgi:arginine/lysine/ornithine decarboxylase
VISRLKHIRLLSKTDLKYAADLDLSKLLIMADGMGGHELMELLRNRYHLECEMASPRAVLAMTTVADSDAGFHRLLEALREIDREMVSEKMMPMPAFPEPVQVMDLYEAGWMPKDVTASDRGEGKLSASYIYLYPPGIPFIVPGEVISNKVLEELINLKNIGYELQGPADETGDSLTVVKE